ncbi:hypothetical protein C0992_002541 [Termitomyces sp. T32_za158]|nr:hypothetical protein C0992_002541 [Termitomyces sp. T32_za158]
MDGNNSLKRIKSIGQQQVGDSWCFNDSNYFLSSDFVDQYAGEVKARPPTVPTDKDEDDALKTLEGNPTDGDVFSGPTGCTDNWKAAAKDEKKKMWAIFSESGIFSSVYQHGFILWIIDMISSSEITKYPLAIVAKLLKLFKKFLLDYDIGCTFETTIEKLLLDPDFKNSKCCCCVNAFHGYTHHYLCQLCNHPNVIEGVGLEDLKT